MGADVVTLGGLALLACGGAAARPGGVWLGLPSLASALLVVAVATGLYVWLGKRDGRGLIVLLAVPALLLSGLPLPGVRALSGPPLLALAGAGIASLLWGEPLRRIGRLFFPVVLAVYVAAAWGAQCQVGAEGDEPHYLMVAESLLRDGDLELEDDYREGRYRAFYKTRPMLEPHYRVRGREGEIYSLHAVGLSLLVLPAYALGGYPGASFFMALLAALLALELRGLLRTLAGDGAQAEAAGWVLALSPPLIHYAGLVFTEVPAALVVALGLRRGRELPGPARAAALGAALAFLPWLNVRYAPLSVVLLGYAGLGIHRRWGSAAALALPGVVSAAALALYHQRLYGFLDPRRVYGARPELSPSALPEGLQGLLLDQEFGLLVYAPVFALAAAGALAVWRRSRRLAVAAALMVAVVAGTAGSWHMWRGGWNPPARFLLPAIPALAPALAAGMGGAPTPATALLVGWGLWTGATGAADPRLVHRDRDGTAPLFRARSGAVEWTGLLPSYVLSEPDRHRLAALWGMVLLLAILPRPRARRFGPGLLAGVVAVAVAAAAARGFSDARSGARDATRVLGRTALAVPGWHVGRADGRWGPEALAWGPLYEPHRHPDGAPLAERLALAAGGYRLCLSGQGFGGDPASLLIRDEPGSIVERELAVSQAGLEGRFELARPATLSLALHGGAPFLIEEVSLEAEAAPR